MGDMHVWHLCRFLVSLRRSCKDEAGWGLNASLDVIPKDNITDPQVVAHQLTVKNLKQICALNLVHVINGWILCHDYVYYEAVFLYFHFLLVQE